MSTQKIMAILLLAVGLSALVYGGVSYTGQSHQADLGSLHFSMNEQHHVNIPIWMGVGALLLGGLLLLPRKA